MNRLAPAVLAVALGVLVHWVRADAGVVALPPGPYAVGFQSYDRRDITRTFFADVTASGEPETRGAGRPIQTSVWYPAVAGSGSKMVFRDYVALSARQYGPVAHDRAARFAERYLRRIAADVGLTEAQIRSIAATPVQGRRMAQALSGRYPLVVYDAGGHGSSWGNYALCEYLASNGFTVVAIPNTWDWDATRSDGETIQSAEAAARDVEFTLAFARQLPYVDPVAPVLMGYSWGGQAALMVALRNNAVGAVVSLDGSEGNMKPVLDHATHHDVARLRATYLVFSSGVDRSMQVALAEGDDPPSAAELETWKEHMAHLPVLEAVRDVDAIHVTMTGFAHSNFTSEVYLADGPKNAFLKRRPGEPSVEDDLAAYRTMASVVLRFLDGYRRGDVSAHAWFELGAATNSVDPHVMTIERRAARTELAPTIDAFARFAGAHGFDALKARVAIERHSDPTYGLSDGDAILWAKQLDALGEHERAGAVLRWAAHLNPNSTDVLFALCDQVPAGDARRECFANLMLLDPTNSDARRETAVP